MASLIVMFKLHTAVFWRTSWLCSLLQLSKLVHLSALNNKSFNHKGQREENITNLMFCWPCITVYRYSDWPCITVYRYSDWPCITVYKYSETNVMHFLFSLLRIKGLYVFRALLAHPQEGLHKQHLIYCVVFCQLEGTRIGTGASDTSSALTLVAANWHNTHAIYQVPFVQRILRMSK
jgi:hypothetical protein